MYDMTAGYGGDECYQRTVFSLLQNPFSGILIFRDQKAVFTNDTAARLTGYTPEELNARNHGHGNLCFPMTGHPF